MSSLVYHSTSKLIWRERERRREWKEREREEERMEGEREREDRIVCSAMVSPSFIHCSLKCIPNLIIPLIYYSVMDWQSGDKGKRRRPRKYGRIREGGRGGVGGGGAASYFTDAWFSC